MKLIDADAITYELWTTEVDVDNKRDNYRYYQNRYMVDRRDIEAMPTVESRPKGKWIRGKIDDENVWYCSNCRHIDDYYGPTANYCWYCGADMRGNSE